MNQTKEISVKYDEWPPAATNIMWDLYVRNTLKHYNDEMKGALKAFWVMGTISIIIKSEWLSYIIKEAAEKGI